MLNLHVLYEYDVQGRPHGSAYIRLMLPLAHPALADAVRVQFDAHYRPCDVLVIDRTWNPWATLGAAEQLLRQARHDGCRILYSLDDDLLDFDEYNVHRRHFSDEQMFVVRLFAREADAVLVSTENLRRRVQRLNPNVHVVPNTLDERLFAPEAVLPPARPPDGQLVLGYMGTFTHEADLYAILEPLRRFLRERVDVARLQIVGVASGGGLVQAFAGVRVEFLRPDQTAEYPAFVRWMRERLRWDIGLAPLVDNPFTRCKSDIKFLDYALLGIPGVYSRVDAYRDSVAHGTTGWLVDNTPDDWYAGLTTLADDPARCGTLRANAFARVRAEHVLATGARRWLEVVQQVAGASAAPERQRLV